MASRSALIRDPTPFWMAVSGNIRAYVITYGG
jgi:hypothetical protein